MTILQWLAGLAALIGLAGFIFFAFRQGMKVRPSGNDHPGTAANYMGGESHSGGDASHS